MGYIWHPVNRDIERLKSLFYSLYKTFTKQKIDDELRKKLVETKKLLETLAEMVRNFEMRYKVDDEEMQDEGDVLEVKKHERIVLELWLEGLEDAVFNTEDLVEKIHTETMRHEFDGQICEKMGDILCSLESYVKQGHVLGLERLVNLQSKHHLYMNNPYWWRFFDPMEGRDDWIESPEECPDPTDNIYFVDKSDVFGMDCVKEKIINLLKSADASGRPLSVISIEGNGRIGKTTLARLVYNEQRVSHHFHLKAWVRVPYGFDRVTRLILEFLSSQDKDHKDFLNDHLYYLQELNRDELLRLQQCLAGKRFLLVLDGAKWTPSSETWEALLSALKDAANGSCIIVTTRNKDIAPKIKAVSTHCMEPLSEEECRLIFAKFAFGDQNPTSDKQLEIGEEIVRMCHGLPSSVRILGSLLRFKLQQEEWEAIRDRLKPSSDSRENVNVVPKSRVPEDLKRCLAYCSIFPQGYEIEEEKLVLLCMAEGFLKPPTNKETMEGARKSIDKLNSIFPKLSGNESSFRMCVDNLAAYVSTRYCFRLEDNHPSQIPLNTRYLSLVGDKYENSVIFEAIDRAKHLRTFLPLDHESRHLGATELQNLLSKLQCLRVLSLSHYHITKIPDSIGNLEHLRYIDLSHTPIESLPESVCELRNLQSLILSNCRSLTKLPENTSKLTNLLDLDVSGSGLSERPEEMSKLSNLRLLSYFVAGKKSVSSLEVLNSFERLEGIHISKLQNVASKAEAAKANLRNKKSLHELVLEWDENTADPKNATEVLEGLQPYEYLEKLTINFYCGKEFAGWFQEVDFKIIFFLRLSNCKNCSTLPPLWKLPKLRVLIIECMEAVEEMGTALGEEPPALMSKEFSYLERLTFEGMSKWTKWVPLDDQFPRLKQLCIRRCPKLRGNLPKELPIVERVEISESQELLTALTTEESLKNLRYRDRIVSISSDGKETKLESERATGSSSLAIEGTEEETHSEFETASETEESKLELSGTEESGESEQETHLEAETASETEGRKLEQEKSIKDPSPSPFSEEKSLLATTQDSLSLSQTPNLGEKADDSTNTRSNQDGPQYLFKSVKVSGLLQLIELPEGLHSLRIEGCDALEDIPKGIMARLNQLQHLYIINCCSLNSLPEDHPPTALKKLYVQNCKKLQIFSPTKRTHQYEFLEHLCIGSSDSLRSLSLDFFPKLSSLSIWDCANLQSLSMPLEIQKDLTSLEALEIRDCPKLESFLKGGLSASNLMSIWLSNCKNLKELPDRLDTLINSLRSLFINNCPELVSLPKLPSSLSLLSITFCYKLELVMDWGLRSLWNLSRLEIEGGCKNVESFPEKGLLPSNLNSLCISELLNLKYLKCKELQHLTALKTLEISCCNKLQPFPEENLPSSLSLLCIKECSLLKPKLLNKRKMFD